MNKLAILLIVIGSLVSGCVPYYVSPNRGGGVNHSEPNHPEHSYNNYNNGHDRDRDGVPNRQDRRPDDPHRY